MQQEGAGVRVGVGVGDPTGAAPAPSHRYGELERLGGNTRIKTQMEAVLVVAELFDSQPKRYWVGPPVSSV